MARASGGCKNMHPLSWGLGGGAQTVKIQSLYMISVVSFKYRTEKSAMIYSTSYAIVGG